MIKLSQPGGAGDITEDAVIFVGTLCYLSSDATEDWHWRLEPPAGSKSELSSMLSFHPNFPPDIKGIYQISFTSNGKTSKLKVKAI